MLLLHAGYLFAQAFVHQAQRILRGRVGSAVVDGVDGEEEIFAAEVVVKTRGAEVFADVLLGMAEGLRNSAAQFRTVLHRPQREQRRDGRIDADELLLSCGVGQIAQARLVVGHEGDGAQSPVLAEALVVAEEEELVRANGAAERSAELVALKLGNVALIEVVARIEGAVANEFECCAVQTDWCRRW